MLLLTEGQVSDYRGAATMLSALPPARVLIADRGSDAGWLRHALRSQGIKPCIPARSCRNTAVHHSKALYKMRCKIEIMFGRLKDWRHIATRYDRCVHTFMSAITLAAIILFWLPRNES